MESRASLVLGTQSGGHGAPEAGENIFLGLREVVINAGGGTDP